MNLGAFILNFPDTDKRIRLAKKLSGINHIRTQINFYRYSGINWEFEKWRDNGFKVLWNLNYHVEWFPPFSFPKDLFKYESKVTAVLNKYHPEIVMVENEEQNKNFHNGTKEDYIDMLEIVLDVAHARGLKITNGGLYGYELKVLTYQWLLNDNPEKAAQFATNCMYQIHTKKINSELQGKMDDVNFYLDYYHNLDYVSLHLYEPHFIAPDPTTITTAAPNVAQEIKDFMEYRTGRPVIITETCQRENDSIDLAKSMFEEYKKINPEYLVWINGDVRGELLFDAAGNLTELGSVLIS